MNNFFHPIFKNAQRGFTLIELSIVLVIIGLIIGGILTGQDLINAAAIRAQLSQIEKYNTAVNTFYNKYGGLPGDLNATTAAQFGMVSCSATRGLGDGNGVLEGYVSGAAYGWDQSGETAFFWTDLSIAGLIDNTFSTAICTGMYPANITTTSNPGFSSIFPPAKIGNGNYVHVFTLSASVIANQSPNYFGISAPSVVLAATANMTANPGLSVAQAANMDKKIDDGKANTGLVQAYYVTSNAVWPPYYAAPNGNPDTAQTCFNSSTGAYSTDVNYGGGTNCVLQFQMQGAGR